MDINNNDLAVVLAELSEDFKTPVRYTTIKNAAELYLRQVEDNATIEVTDSSIVRGLILFYKKGYVNPTRAGYTLRSNIIEHVERL